MGYLVGPLALAAFGLTLVLWQPLPWRATGEARAAAGGVVDCVSLTGALPAAPGGGLQAIEACSARCRSAPDCWAVEWSGRDEASGTSACRQLPGDASTTHLAGALPSAAAFCYVRGLRASLDAVLANVSSELALAALDARDLRGLGVRAERVRRSLRALAAVRVALRAKWREDSALLGPTLHDSGLAALPERPRHLAAGEGHRFRRLDSASREQLQVRVDELEQRVRDLEHQNCDLLKDAGKECDKEEAEQGNNGAVFNLKIGGPPALPPPPQLHWSWEAWVCLGILATVLALVALYSCVWCTFLSPRSLVTDLSGAFSVNNFLYQPVSAQGANEMQVIGKLLQREMRLRILTPFLIPALCFHWTTCSDGTPWWGYGLALLLMTRAKYFEWWVLRKVTKSGWRSLFTFSFATGLMDHFDWFTDGVFCVQAYKCDPGATRHFLDIITESVASPMQPFVRVVGFWFFPAISVFTALIAQQTLGSIGKGINGLASAADVACFGAVANHYANLEPEAERGLMKVAVVFSKILLKNSMQLWLQSTFFGMAFDDLTLNGKAKILLALTLGMGCAAFKTRLAATVTCQQLFTACYYGRPDLAFLVLCIFLVQLFAFCLVAWTITKVYMSFTCPTHLWNISYGCVDHLSQSF